MFYLHPADAGDLPALNSKFTTYESGSISLNNLSWSSSGVKFAVALTRTTLGGIPVAAMITAFSGSSAGDVIDVCSNEDGDLRLMSNKSSFSSSASVKIRALVLKD